MLNFKNLFSGSWGVFWRWIAAPLVASIVGAVLIGRLTGWFVGPDTYKVYIVGDFNSSLDRKLEDLKDAFLDSQKNSEIGQVKITFRSVNAKEQDAADVSAKLVTEPDTLMVVGHLTSTASKSALPHYLHATPPIPVILPVETNPELLPPDYKSTYYPVFRLSPTDEEQAKEAARFVVNNSAKAIWVVEDSTENPVYSHYLAQQFVKQVHELKSSKVLLWTSNRELPSGDAIQALKINWVFFAGDWSNGLILTRQVKEMWKNQQIPSILLSNFCGNNELLDEGGSDMKGVYLLHPMMASNFYVPGFAYWGTLARQLTERLISEAKDDFEHLAAEEGGLWYRVRSVMGIHSVADARNALRALMRSHVQNGESFYLNEQKPPLLRFTFNPDGTGSEAKFWLWQVQDVGGVIKFVDKGTPDKFVAYAQTTSRNVAETAIPHQGRSSAHTYKKNQNHAVEIRSTRH
jgi:ABC-type branched-subunit amino acid transport system substrate-binding protein